MNPARTYNIKVYSYDDCGNQSDSAAEIEEIDPNRVFENGALQLTDSGDYAVIPHADVLAPVQLTVECWIYLDGETGEQTIVDKRDASGGYNLRIAGDAYPLGIAFVVKDAEEGILFVEGVMDHSTWIHVAATYDGNEMRIYVNGELAGEQNVTKNISQTQTPLIIGEFLGYEWDSFVFHGAIDDLRIWGVARPENEIKNTKDDFLKGDELYLAGYWKFDENVGTWISDASPNHNHGTLSGVAKTIASTAPIGPSSRVHHRTVSMPQTILLNQNYPNPFNPTTLISYNLPVAGNVELAVFSVTGRKVKSLVSDFQSAGQYNIPWNAMDIPGGVYFIKILAGNTMQMRKAILLK